MKIPLEMHVKANLAISTSFAAKNSWTHSMEDKSICTSPLRRSCTVLSLDSTHFSHLLPLSLAPATCGSSSNVSCVTELHVLNL